MDRRDFMRKIGGGLIIAFAVSDLTLLNACANQPGEKRDVNAYLRIGGDERVTLYTGKIEMGQGPITSLPMMLADELDVSLDSVDIIMGDTELCPWDNGTFGSLSTRAYGQVMRAAAAEARAILLKMAAAELSGDSSKVTPGELQVIDGVISIKGNDSKNISYAQLTNGKEILETVSEKPSLKTPSEMKIMGTSRLHVDAELKATGEAIYSGDLHLPGMMYARIVRPPSLGAKLISIDTSGAESIEGVEIVKVDELVAVLHESQDIAEVAVSKVKAEWEEEVVDVDDKSLYTYLVKKGTQVKELKTRGELDGSKQSDQIFSSEFRDPYLAHAPIETHTATAVFEEDVLKVWASCQTPFPTMEDISEALDIPQSNVRLMQIFTGGGFGGKIYNPQAVEVAKLVNKAKKPIQLTWSREEEFMYDRLRPAAVVKIDSALDEAGKIVMWDYHIYFGGKRGATTFYEIPNHRTSTHDAPKTGMGHPFFKGAWRGPSNNTNTFARESHMEIMAYAAGKDALEFRLDHLKNNEKMTKVLEAGAEKFGWTQGKRTRGKGHGIACGIDAGTYVAVFVEVEVNKKTGHVQVIRAVVSQDMGLVVNPQGAIIQAEGCVIMGMGYSLSEEIKFESRKMLTRNFDTYELPRFSWVPEIDVVLIDAQDKDPQGGGEPAIICMGGAIANAVFDATGARIYQLPVTPDRVLEALKG